MRSLTQPLRKSFFATVAGYDIFIEVDGSGPFMIMTHGLGANTNVFQPLTEIFSNDFTVARFDWPGLGHSTLSKDGSKVTVPSLVEVLVGVMDILETPQAVLVGHSLGGIVSMTVAAKWPSRVSGLAVIGAGRTRATPSEAKDFTLRLAAEARENGCQFTTDARVAYNIPSESPALSRALLRAVTAATNPEGYAQICEALCDDSHVDPGYSQIVCPTCVIGGEYDPISPISVTDNLMELLGGSRAQATRHILSTGHMIIEDPEGTARAIKTMLVRVA